MILPSDNLYFTWIVAPMMLSKSAPIVPQRVMTGVTLTRTRPQSGSVSLNLTSESAAIDNAPIMLAKIPIKETPPDNPFCILRKVKTL